ncbi:hypothetical protein KAU32_01535 [bacterium]|nr:hypothetical protein [bacterium]
MLDASKQDLAEAFKFSAGNTLVQQISQVEELFCANKHEKNDRESTFCEQNYKKSCECCHNDRGEEMI